MKLRSLFSIFAIATQFFLLIGTVSSPNVYAANVAREPMQGYWVGHTGGTYVNTLFQSWSDAAAVLCGGSHKIHPNTKGPSRPKEALNLWCLEDKTNNAIISNGAWWQDACPGWSSVMLHDPQRKCYDALEKPPCKCDRYGNPISMSTQAKIQVEHDYEPRNLLGFSRYYDSRKAEPRLNAMSSAWRHNYSWTMKSTLPSGNGLGLPYSINYRMDGSIWPEHLVIPRGSEHYANVMGPDGYGYRFLSTDGGNSWVSDADVTAKLVVSIRDMSNRPIEWELTDEEGNTLAFDADGHFLRKSMLTGGSIELTYSDSATPAASASKPGLLLRVADNYGQTISFSYDLIGRLIKLVTPSLDEYTYAYDAKHNLTSVIYPDGLGRFYHYDEQQITHNTTSPYIEIF